MSNIRSSHSRKSFPAQSNQSQKNWHRLFNRNLPSKQCCHQRLGEKPTEGHLAAASALSSACYSRSQSYCPPPSCYQMAVILALPHYRLPFWEQQSVDFSAGRLANASIENTSPILGSKNDLSVWSSAGNLNILNRLL